MHFWEPYHYVFFCMLDTIYSFHFHQNFDFSLEETDSSWPIVSFLEFRRTETTVLPIESSKYHPKTPLTDFLIEFEAIGYDGAGSKLIIPIQHQTCTRDFVRFKLSLIIAVLGRLDKIDDWLFCHF